MAQNQWMIEYTENNEKCTTIIKADTEQEAIQILVNDEGPFYNLLGTRFAIQSVEQVNKN